jgi:hypothetical protein
MASYFRWCVPLADGSHVQIGDTLLAVDAEKMLPVDLSPSTEALCRKLEGVVTKKVYVDDALLWKERFHKADSAVAAAKDDELRLMGQLTKAGEFRAMKERDAAALRAEHEATKIVVPQVPVEKVPVKAVEAKKKA